MKDSEVLLMLILIIDDYADNSHFGGDSDADDFLPIDVNVSEGTIKRSLNSSDHNNTPHSIESPFTPSKSTSLSLNQNVRPQHFSSML